MSGVMSEKEKKIYNKMVEGAQQMQLDLDDLMGPNIYGYARSAGRRRLPGNYSLAEQKKRLKEAGAERIFIDTYSDSKADAPQLRHLVSTLRKDDILIVTGLDRLGRTASQAASVLLSLLEAGVSIRVLDLGILDGESVSHLMLKTLSAFSGFDNIRRLERMQEGKETARKQPGHREGRPRKYTVLQMDHAMSLLQTYSFSQVEEMTGISRATLVREKKRRADGTG